MFTFFSPAALFGLLLLAIPIIVHLLKPRKVRRTPFSSLRWLHLTKQRLSRRLRWHQLLLFLVRAAFITALVLAIARPLWHRGAAGIPTDRVIVLDVSRSMGYRTGDEPTALERGKLAVESLLQSEQAHDRTALLATGSSTRILCPLVAEAKRFAPALFELKVSSTETDLGSALDVTRSLLEPHRGDARIELFVVTDNHEGAWRPGAIDALRGELPATAQVTIVDVSAPAPQNGWIADARFTPAENHDPPRIDVQLRGIGATQTRSVRLAGLDGVGAREQSVTLRPGEPTQLHFELPVNLAARGQGVEVILEPADHLPSDDRWFLNLDDHASLRALVIEGRGTGPVAPGFALRTALESLSTPASRLQVTSKTSLDVAPEDVRGADAIFWADVPELSEIVLTELDERVRAGLGLAIFLGPDVSTDFYNARLYRPLNPAQGLLPQRLDRVVEVPASQGGLQPLESVAWHHPLLAGLFDPALGDLGQVQVNAYYRFSAPLDESDTILATVAGSPVLIEHSVGSGSVVWCQLSADDRWSDLPRRKSFVPLVDRLLDHLAQGARRRNFAFGEAIQLVVATPANAPSAFLVRGPGGMTIQPSISTRGERSVVRLAPPSEPGIYRLEHEGRALPEATFVVQLGRGDSRLTPTDPAQLRAWWEPLSLVQGRADEVLSRYARRSATTSLTTWLLLLAALLFVLEMLLVHWLCPRMNPALAHSMIQGRRLVVSTDDPAETSLTTEVVQ